MNSADFLSGEVFKIGARRYRGYVFVVKTVREGAIDCVCEQRKNEIFTFVDAALRYYEKQIKFLEREPKMTENQIAESATSDDSGGANVFTAFSSGAGSSDELQSVSDREFRAKIKAENELRNNQTIRFERGVLRFTSRESGREYIVTKDGCSTNCPAHRRVHYHAFLYRLCSGRF